MAKVITIHSCKGGSGKTTLSILMLEYLARRFKCLAIDTDIINHSLSFYLNAGIDYEVIKQRNIFTAWLNGIEESIIDTGKNIDMIHSDIRLSDFRSTDNLGKFKRMLEPIRQAYDFIVIDTAPAFDNITANILKASDYLFIPTIPDLFNYQAVKFEMDKLTDMELSELDINIIFNQYEKPRSDNPDTLRNQVINLFKDDLQIAPYLSSHFISRSARYKNYLIDNSLKINNNEALPIMADIMRGVNA